MSTRKIDIDPVVIGIAMQIQVEYRKAVEQPYIRKPLAYALHQVWKTWDAFEPEREGGAEE